MFIIDNVHKGQDRLYIYIHKNEVHYQGLVKTKITTFRNNYNKLEIKMRLTIIKINLLS